MFSYFYGPLWYYYALDWLTYLILIPAILFSLYAQYKVSNTFSKYQSRLASSGLTGAEVARKLLNQAGVVGVSVVPCKGNLTDNYNPKTRVLSLSESVFSSSSVSAISVAAHEVGHAIQHSENYLPLKLRSVLVPATKIGSILAIPLAILGVIIEWLAGIGSIGTVIISLGVIAYSLTTVFSLITLPVEFNASNRAKKLLLSTGILNGQETKDAGKVLSSAALTYVASLAVSLMYLFRFLIILSRFRRDD